MGRLCEFSVGLAFGSVKMRSVLFGAAIALCFASGVQAKSFSSRSNRDGSVHSMMQHSTRRMPANPARDIIQAMDRGRDFDRRWDDNRDRSNNRGNGYGHNPGHGPRFPVPRRPRNCSPH